MINLVFIGLGMITSANVIMLVVIPIMLPGRERDGHRPHPFRRNDRVVNMMIGLTTPPFGGLLFVTSAVSNTSLGGIIKQIFPMILVLMLVLFLITFVPEFVMFLPNLAK